MFVKNYYILNRIQFSSSSASNASPLINGVRSPEDLRNIKYSNGEYINLERFIYYGTGNGRGYGSISGISSNGYTVLTFEATTRQSNENPQYNANQTYNGINTTSNITGYNELYLRVGEGIANDTTPVTLDDYTLSNILFDDKINLSVQCLNGGVRQVTISNITSDEVTIREIGIFQSPCSINSTYYQYDDTSDQFTIKSQSGYQYPVALIWKVKLNTPIIIPGNSSKNITVDFALPTA